MNTYLLKVDGRWFHGPGLLRHAANGQSLTPLIGSRITEKGGMMGDGEG